MLYNAKIYQGDQGNSYKDLVGNGVKELAQRRATVTAGQQTVKIVSKT
jgi:hypothetical protein